MWAHEAADFTPWLAHPDNIKRLGDAIGLELEVEHIEVAVGPFAADILAREAATGAYVVIENQLNRTDHDHLGKALHVRLDPAFAACKTTSDRDSLLNDEESRDRRRAEIASLDA